MDNFEIEVLEDDQEENEPVQLPLNFLTIGEIENDDVKVYIKQDVYKALEEYAASDVNHELGTIILGQYSEEMGKMHVIISDFILAKYTDASASTLTFTHETWDYVHKEHDEKYPDKKIVGWQHTHPGYGIFLSNYDMFIQENFFNIPFQVAYVIDPVQHLRGFFQWKGGKVEKLKGFYIYDDLGKTIKIDQPKVKKNIEGATKAGIQVGVYFFTQAVNVTEAMEEASIAVSLVKDYPIAYPIFIDTEGAGTNARAANLDVETRTEVCRTFCETVEAAGYNGGVYASKNWLNKNLNTGKLSNYYTWLAEYKGEATYEGNYDFWQYTSGGHVDGIDGRVDLNVGYVGFN